MKKHARHESVRTVVLAVLALGLLIWAKLRLVTSIPRSAFADPDQKKRAATQVQPKAGPVPEVPQQAAAEVLGTDPARR